MPRNKNKGKLKKAVTAPCILEQLDESDVSSEDEYQDEFSPLFRKHQPEYVCTLPDDHPALNMALEELGETPEIRHRGIHELRQWLKQHPAVSHPRLDAHFLLRFLRTEKFDFMKAKKRLEKYFKVRHQNPELYGNLDIQENTKLREIVEEGSTIVLPGTDFEGRRVVFHIAKRLDVCRFDASDLIRSWLLALETISQDEAVLCNGVTYVLDFDGVHWPYVAIWGPGQFQNVVSTGEKAFPLRHKNILIGNPPTGFWIMYEICKIAITSKIRDRIKVKNLDPGYLLESIPANILPKEYGGTRDMQELIDLWKEECFSQRDKVLTMDRTTYYMKEERGWFRSFMSFGSWLGSIPFEVLHKILEKVAYQPEILQAADQAAEKGDSSWTKIITNAP